MLESVLLLITGAVVAAPMLPGLTLCVPALVLLAVAVLLPIIAVAALATLVGVVPAIPYLLVHSIGDIRSRMADRAPVPPPVPATGTRTAGEAMGLQT